MNILITGATGFIGSNLLKHLSLNSDNKITAIVSSSEQSIPEIHKCIKMHMDGIDWNHVKNQNIVFHQAANNDTLDNDEDEMYKANVSAPIKLFETAMAGGCKRFVYASSTAIYGNSPAPYIEDTTTINPLNAYAKSKFEFEKYAKSIEHKATVVGLRYCNVYGPGEYHKGKRSSMIYQLIEKIRQGISLEIFSAGDQKRDWVYVKDVVKANILAASSKESGICNIGSGKAVSFNELIDIIKHVLQKQVETKYIQCPFESSYQSHTECDVKKAKLMLGWEPEYDVKKGVEEFVKEIEKH